ncbi:hypothetical protein PV783_14010 [Chitinophaga sp. CC14]|uniref:hypothetical protein n=1 Tax=Chitinophaga sp. CC14 TaxID=3029199 RepID=UPI003B820D96
MDIKLRRLIEHSDLTTKTVAYSGILYINKKKVAMVFNDGKGEKTDITAYSNADFRMVLEAQKFIEKSAPSQEAGNKPWTNNLSQYLDNLAADHFRKLNEKCDYTPDNLPPPRAAIENGRSPLDDSNKISIGPKIENIQKKGKLSTKMSPPGPYKSRRP